MIDGIHGHTADMRPLSLPPAAAGLAEFGAAVFGIADLTDTCATELVEPSNLAGGELHQHMAAFLCHELRGSACAPYHLGALADLHFNIMNNGSQWNIKHGDTVAGLDVNIFTRHDPVADG